jgi:hypothetical protein
MEPIFEHEDANGDGFSVAVPDVGKDQLRFYPTGEIYSILTRDDVLRLNSTLATWLTATRRTMAGDVSPNPGDHLLRAVIREELARAFDRMAVEANRLNHSQRDYIDGQALEMVRETADATADNLREN